MTRTFSLKAVYFVRLSGLLIAAVAAGATVKEGETAVALAWTALAAVMLLSGRIQAHYWWNLLSGLHRLNLRDYAGSKDHSELFLAELRERPWLRHFIWLGPSSYTLNAEVLTLNNLGGAEIELGNLHAPSSRLRGSRRRSLSLPGRSDAPVW